MSSLVLWGQPKSINVQKPLWALEELGLKYEHKLVGGSLGGHKEPAYLALNPNGLIPTLVDDGEPIWESNAIVRYLFSQYGKSPAHPASPIARARADAWTDWKSSVLWLHVRPLVVQLVRTKEDQRDQALIESSYKASVAAVQLLDHELSKHAYLVGDEFTWADIPVGSALQRWYNLPIKRPGHKALDAYYARLQQRPGFSRWVDLGIF
ncbi:MAG: putative glutathione S-transferase [Myxococcaceae bacterium]|nr:putative glutathione S-transferase [Myxococcaceae bacterium]